MERKLTAPVSPTLGPPVIAPSGPTYVPVPSVLSLGVVVGGPAPVHAPPEPITKKMKVPKMNLSQLRAMWDVPGPVPSAIGQERPSPKRKSPRVRKLVAKPRKKIFDCQHCDEKFSSQRSRNTHMRSHDGAHPFQCDQCKRTFYHHGSLKEHKRTHTGERPFTCDQCNKTFAQSSTLREHIRTHTGDRPYPCSTCNKAFITASKLSRHKRTHTGDKPYTCEDCGRLFARSDNLQRHRREHGEKPFKCKFLGCTKEFTQKAALKEHQLTHSGEKPFTCEECGKGFTSARNLKRHKPMHTNFASRVGVVTSADSQEAGVAVAASVLSAGVIGRRAACKPRLPSAIDGTVGEKREAPAKSHGDDSEPSRKKQRANLGVPVVAAATVLVPSVGVPPPATSSSSRAAVPVAASASMPISASSSGPAISAAASSSGLPTTAPSGPAVSVSAPSSGTAVPVPAAEAAVLPPSAPPATVAATLP